VATALDELSKQPVATTGAVLTAGEELRPTGSDRALLSRVAELTGGKVRDTLAGIFTDREAKRFSYRNLTVPLILLAGLLMLAGVASRRLAMPEGLSRFRSAVASRLARPKERRAERAAARAEEARAQVQTLDALRDVKQKSAGHAPPVVRDDVAPASVPRFARAPVPPRGAPAAPPRTPTSAPSGAAGGAGPPSTRQLSAAEILLARRRGRKG
jgi:hypothetical protein